MSKRINLFLDDQEVRVLEALLKKYGGKPTQMLKDALKLKFDKAFPAHKIRVDEKEIIPEEHLTNEQICEKHGGVIKTLNGIRVCERRLGTAMTETAPLGDPDIESW